MHCKLICFIPLKQNWPVWIVKRDGFQNITFQNICLCASPLPETTYRSGGITVYTFYLHEYCLANSFCPIPCENLLPGCAKLLVIFQTLCALFSSFARAFQNYYLRSSFSRHFHFFVYVFCVCACVCICAGSFIYLNFPSILHPCPKQYQDEWTPEQIVSPSCWLGSLNIYIYFIYIYPHIYIYIMSYADLKISIVPTQQLANDIKAGPHVTSSSLVEHVQKKISRRKSMSRHRQYVSKPTKAM